MKRCTCLLLILSACLIATGCRRGGSGPRKPVLVAREADLLMPKNEGERMLAVRPPERKIKLYLKTIKQVEQEAKTPSEQSKIFRKVLAEQEEMEKDTEGKGNANITAAAKAKAGAEEAEDEFTQTIPFVLKFLREIKPRYWYQENLRMFVSRQDNAVHKRKWLDKLNMEAFEEEIMRSKFFKDGTMTFVPEIDPKVEDYIIAHRDAAGGGGGGGGGGGMLGGGGMMGDPGGGGGGGMMGGPGGGGGAAAESLVWLNKKDGLVTMPGAELSTKLKFQELRLLRMNFITFARTNYMRAPIEPDETKIWRANIAYPSYDALMDGQPWRDPSVAYLLVAQRMPHLMKNPPESFEVGKFKVHLKENAPPSVLIKLGSQETAINVAANLMSPKNIIACRNEMEYSGSGEKSRALGHLVILVDGSIEYAPTQTIRVFAPAPAPKEEGPGGGGMKMPKMK